MFIAVYGTLKSGYGNSRLLQNCTLVGTGHIQGHRLYQSGIPYVVKDDTSDYSIEVEVYKVPSTELDSIDSLEGHPRWYRREPTEVVLADGTVLAEIYKVQEAPQGTKENTSGVY